MNKSKTLYNIEEIAMHNLKSMSEEERIMFDTKLLHAVHNDATAAMYAFTIVEGAEVKGVYERVKFGAETYPEIIGSTPLS